MTGLTLILIHIAIFAGIALIICFAITALLHLEMYVLNCPDYFAELHKKNWFTKKGRQLRKLDGLAAKEERKNFRKQVKDIIKGE